MLMKNLYDGIIGLAIGDALGVPLEFKTRSEIAKNPVISMQEYGSHNQPIGTWSDDTSLTLALLDSIIQCKTINHEDIMDKFSAWLLYGDYTASGEVFDVGNSTSRAIMNYGRGMSPLNCGGISEYENGNGSLMRILPVAYYLCYLREDEKKYQMEVVHNVSALTHRHPISLIGCGIYVKIAIKMISTSLTLNECIAAGIQEAFAYYESMGAEYISEYSRLKNLYAFMKLSNDEIRSSGFVVDTLEAAVWCLMNTNSYKSCVLKVVNLGYDTDTVGAVAGGLAGIYYGVDTIPAEWIQVIARRKYIKQLCDQFESYFQ